MSKLKFKGSERLNIVISSGADARKKSKVLSMKRSTFVLIVSTGALLLVAFIGAAVFSVLKAAGLL